MNSEVLRSNLFFDKDVIMLENLLEYYRKSEGVTKKKIIGCIFAEKTVFKHRAQSTGLSVIETALPQDSKTARQQDSKTKRQKK